ncbi:MAG: phenylalanine--tRNA ligase subunit beta [Gammaproteobacteria bacterium]
MRLSEHWLREWVDPGISSEALVERLTLAGLEVDAVTAVAPPFSGVEVAEVVQTEPHPQRTQLRVCQVLTGSGERLTIVCGAANARAGLRVALARLGAVLPGREPIAAARFGSVASAGMLCSAAELGLGEVGRGILELESQATLGIDLRRHLALDDHSIEVNLTPNRGDCLSVAGLAREIGALLKRPVTAVEVREVPAQIEDRLAVHIEAPAHCPVYAGRILRGVDTRATTPWWMRERLRRSGLRAISPIVDITNYVLLELGQPLHAFDLARLRSPLRVRLAQAGETLTLLDGQCAALDADTLVIADAERAVALAGVMGGMDTAVGAATVDVFLESAFFNPHTIAGKTRRYKLQSDSAYRFERGVDFGLQRRAIERATALTLQVCGGRPGPVIEHVFAQHLPARVPIPLRAARLRRLLGIEFERARVKDILQGLGLQVSEAAGGWRAVPPSFRFDLVLEADLIEEVARVQGYEHIPGRVPLAPLQMRKHPESRVSHLRLRERLTALGYHEAVTYSFVDPALQARIEPDIEGIRLANPIASDLSVMRTSLWPGLLNALVLNRNRQAQRVRLFELGRVFTRSAEAIEETPVLAMLAWGPCDPKQWAQSQRDTDFFDLKGDIESLAALGGAGPEITWLAEAHPALHPGQTSRILYRGEPAGWCGALHPRIATELGLEGRVLLGQITLDALDRRAVPHYQAVSRFPLVRRDLSFVVDREVTATALLECLRQALGELQAELQVFDLYHGEGIDSRKKSIALGLTFQSASSTLIDAEVEAAIQRGVQAVGERLGGELRA